MRLLLLIPLLLDCDFGRLSPRNDGTRDDGLNDRLLKSCEGGRSSVVGDVACERLDPAVTVVVLVVVRRGYIKRSIDIMQYCGWGLFLPECIVLDLGR